MNANRWLASFQFALQLCYISSETCGVYTMVISITIRIVVSCDLTSLLQPIDTYYVVQQLFDNIELDHVTRHRVLGITTWIKPKSIDAILSSKNPLHIGTQQCSCVAINQAMLAGGRTARGVFKLHILPLVSWCGTKIMEFCPVNASSQWRTCGWVVKLMGLKHFSYDCQTILLIAHIGHWPKINLNLAFTWLPCCWL